MKKTEVLKIIDEVMNNREIDSIRNAILAIRDKVVEFEEGEEIVIDDFAVVKIALRGNNPLAVAPFYGGERYVCIDTSDKQDTGVYGIMWYE